MLEYADRVGMVEVIVVELEIGHIHAIRLQVPLHRASRLDTSRDEPLVHINGMRLCAAAREMAAEE